MGLRVEGVSLPEPQAVFLHWLAAQPADADLAEAARREVERLACYTGGHPGPIRLARMFSALVEHLGRPVQ